MFEGTASPLALVKRFYRMLPRTLEPEVMDTVEEAVDYDSMDHSEVNRRFAADFAELAAEASLPSDCSILDLGTGTALIPLEMLKQGTKCGSIIANDLSVEMLKLASKRVGEAGAGQKILPLFSDAKQLPVANASCDAVISNSIVHHIPEPLDVFREIQRCLRPGGVLFVRDLMRPTDAETLERLVQTYAGNENDHSQQLFRQSLHAALTVEEVQNLLQQSGFPSHWVDATSDRHWTIAGIADTTAHSAQI